MEVFQIMISSIFSIIGAASILFIAARAYTVGSDVAEVKELLKEIRRETQRRDGLAIPSAAPGTDPELGNWPSVTDPRYNANAHELPYGLRTVEEPDQTVVTNRPSTR